MLFQRDYRRPFWRGLLHAVAVVIYSLFISLIILSLDGLFQNSIGYVVQFAFWIFLLVLSIGVCGYLIFYQPIEYVLKHHFRAASVMMASTLGWLLIFLTIFLIGLVLSIASV